MPFFYSSSGSCQTSIFGIHSQNKVYAMCFFTRRTIIPSHSSSDISLLPVPPVMIIPATDSRDEVRLPQSALKTKRSRGIQKTSLLNVVDTKPKRNPLVDETGDLLLDQLYATYPQNEQVDDSHSISCGSVMDSLRSSFAGVPKVSSCASSTSCSSVHTVAMSVLTTATSVDSNGPLHLIPPEGPTGESLPYLEEERSTTKANHGDLDEVFTLDDPYTRATIERLAADHGGVAHMGILDRSCKFFLNEERTGALSFKVQSKIAVVGGDPLCDTDTLSELLAEFATYRQRHHWGIAFIGASECFLRNYAQPKGWASIRFGTERVLNPQTNEVLLEKSGKRITTQNRKLLNPNKVGITLSVYAPAVHGPDPQLQANLMQIYEAWRADRNCSTSPQAFITIYDLFTLPGLMTFVYSRSASGTINGFVALRRLGSGGYHADPCIATPGSAKGISDLLLVKAMDVLHRAEVSYLGVGFEPLDVLASEDVVGMPFPLRNMTRKLYSLAFKRLPINGKKAYHDKFRPDPSQDSKLYIIFPSAVPGPRHLLSMLHVANISLHKLLWVDLRSWVSSRRTKPKARMSPDAKKIDSGELKADHEMLQPDSNQHSF